MSAGFSDLATVKLADDKRTVEEHDCSRSAASGSEPCANQSWANLARRSS